MKILLLLCLSLFFASFLQAEPAADLKGRGDWSKGNQAISFRVTPDKTEYQIGDPFRVLLEIRNISDMPFTLYRETQRSTELNLILSQKDGQFSKSSTALIPNPDKTKTQSVVLGSGATFSQIILLKPWGPTYGSRLAEAQPGPMILQARLLYFLSPDKKTKEWESKPLTLDIKPNSK